MLVVLFIIHHILAMQAETATSFLVGVDNSEFPLENIPFGVVSTKQNPASKFTATRIGTCRFTQVLGSST